MNFFISYSHSDEQLASEIESLLKSMNIDSFMDKMNIFPGDDINDKVKEAIRACEAMIVIVSPGSVKSQWVLFEIGFAMALDKKIIPYVTHLQLELPPVIATIYHIGDIKTLGKYVGQYSSSGHFPFVVQSDTALVSPGIVNNGYVMVVGGANREYILTLNDPLRLGSKHRAKSFSFVGGSGVNITLRLLNAGIPVIPILEVGDDDIGREIQNEIIKSASKTPVASEIIEFVSGPDFFVTGLSTPDSTIIIEKDNRTIFTSEPTAEIDFNSHIQKRIDKDLKIDKNNIRALTIGHIHSDRHASNSPLAGKSTQYLFNRFGARLLVYANFGDSQIRLGLNYWKSYISKIGILQLNLHEMKTFLTPGGQQPLSLYEIINELIAKKINAIITLDRFGAIGISKYNERQVIIAWPFDIDNIVDTTGAGDAFGAGMVANTLGTPKIDFNQMYSSIDDGRFWASYACTTPGGACDCPTRAELDDHKISFKGREELILATEDIASIKQILRIFDRAL